MVIQEITALSNAVRANPVALAWHPMFKIALMTQQVAKDNKDAPAVDWNRVERGFIPYQHDPELADQDPFVRAMRTMDLWKQPEHPRYNVANVSVDIASSLASLAYLLEQTRWSGFLGTSWKEVKDNILAAYREAGVRLPLE
ncbi:hypothetical protein G6L94_31095 [Agrobacterium rhizogenes]|uniref:hypothetical protein n=1 Tax=Rhizobium rhizogenes TaxID=359 RepID=UPI00080FDDBB|nr:hypothetical protein [Rhizobium rhizogenes]OCJ22130.1 hypothetical protein A6U88_30120 [Agrobacterium sp. B131/95]OCJ27335.1 hypothetical protein A6U89_29640 [Agrobacterium sp. B133/95]NTI46091.1 hypothetical protein [Rhizobium rhizogenes]NTI52775.1 hypothetical protein [Rhizobium rhizogenes]NTI98148.1 hypothetical protein [Rhizobium rhizogenes]